MKKSALLWILAVVIFLGLKGPAVLEKMNMSPEAHLAIIAVLLVVIVGAIVWIVKLESSDKKIAAAVPPGPPAPRPSLKAGTSTGQMTTASRTVAGAFQDAEISPVPSASEPTVTKATLSTAPSVAVCAECGAADQGTRFCQECGKPFVSRRVCGRCGTALEAGKRFCSECGAKLV
jgi:hypothetical protein